MQQGAYWTTGQVAKALGVVPRTVAKWYDQSELSGYTLPRGGDRRISVESVVALCRKHDYPIPDILNPCHHFLFIGFNCDSPLLKQIQSGLSPLEVHIHYVPNFFEAGCLKATPCCALVSVPPDADYTIASRALAARTTASGLPVRVIGITCGSNRNQLPNPPFIETFSMPVDAEVLIARLRRHLELYQ